MYVTCDLLSGDLRHEAHPQRKNILKLIAPLPLPTNLGKLPSPDKRESNSPLFLSLVYNNRCVVGGPRALDLITC